MKLSERLKEIRLEHRFSQEELSEKSGLSLRTIQRIENGEGTPRDDTLRLLAQTFDIPFHFFNRTLCKTLLGELYFISNYIAWSYLK